MANVFSPILTEKAIKLGWKFYTENGKLPKTFPTQLQNLIDKNDMNPFKYPAKWYSDMILYKGDPKTTIDWIFVCTGAGYYKVGTKYSVWATRAHNREGKLYLSCEFGPFQNLLEELDLYFFY